MNDLSRAYIAGLFDGDGCISINYHKKTEYGSLQCLLTTTDVPTVVYFKARYGGYTQMLKRRKSSWRDQYQWCISATNAMRFLANILPFLRIKGEQALIGIEYQKLINKNRCKRISEVDRQKRQELRLKLANLKQVPL